jgi:murein DD-endopeptidase MepM/ murein hydrolase activator NlpD
MHSGNITTRYDRAYGNYIDIDDGVWKTRYAHLSTAYFKSGGEVNQGDCIGIMGDTGNSEGIHLHIECYYRGKLVNVFSVSTFNKKVEP